MLSGNVRLSIWFVSPNMPLQDLTMHPFRAFMLSFAIGTAALFGGYGFISAMTPAPVAHTITV
jgi:hypothetical protein